MPKKTKRPSKRKRTKSHPTGHKPPRKKQPTRKRKRKAPRPKSAAQRVAALAVTAAEPVGACLWVDSSGQNHCKTMTQSACKGISGSTFLANKQCPGGIG